MDGDQFDRFSRVMGQGSTRRALLSLATVLGLGSVLDGEAKKKGKKKKKCKGGTKKCGKRCIAASACCKADDCLPCQNVFCQANGTCNCNPGSTMYNGACGEKPDCLPNGALTGAGPDDCCSRQAFFDNQHGIWVCQPGFERCVSHLDCISGNCRGFMCPEVYHLVTGCP